MILLLPAPNYKNCWRNFENEKAGSKLLPARWLRNTINALCFNRGFLIVILSFEMLGTPY